MKLQILKSEANKRFASYGQLGMHDLGPVCLFYEDGYVIDLEGYATSAVFPFTSGRFENEFAAVTIDL